MDAFDIKNSFKNESDNKQFQTLIFSVRPYFSYPAYPLGKFGSKFPV